MESISGKLHVECIMHIAYNFAVDFLPGQVAMVKVAARCRRVPAARCQRQPLQWQPSERQPLQRAQPPQPRQHVIGAAGKLFFYASSFSLMTCNSESRFQVLHIN